MSEEEKSTPPTQEELEKRSKELTAFYKKELPLLRLRSEYEELLTKIDVSKMTRIEIMMAKAQMMEDQEGRQNQPPQAPPQGTPENTEHIRPINSDKGLNVKKPKGKRELKKVK
tara:strand:+ start:1407 stop:1748 length:342 start_codon:yes stop_codon:yes gene_type:complete